MGVDTFVNELFYELKPPIASGLTFIVSISAYTVKIL